LAKKGGREFSFREGNTIEKRKGHYWRVILKSSLPFPRKDGIAREANCCDNASGSQVHNQNGS
ncbi:MAG: hypothetical protein VYA94_00420, partial [Candidatus Thermoplasmatota archaeon]|nr:hypothetical protein [Candidatus Thermoplasmatota archaeon]